MGQASQSTGSLEWVHTRKSMPVVGPGGGGGGVAIALCGASGRPPHPDPATVPARVAPSCSYELRELFAPLTL